MVPTTEFNYQLLEKDGPKSIEIPYRNVKKWKRETANLKVVDVVYVSDYNVSPLQWPIAKVIYVYSDPDQFVRVVKTKTATGIYNRPVHKLRKLLDVKDAA